MLHDGSDGELSSGTGLEAMGVVESMDGVVRASRELYTVADVPKRSTGLDANLIVRGVSAEGFAMRRVASPKGARFGRARVNSPAAHRRGFAGIEPGATDV